MGNGTTKAAVVWPDSTIDIVDVVSGACVASYSSDKKGKTGGGGAGDGGAGVGADRCKVSALAFAHKVGEGTGAEVASPRSQASGMRGKEEGEEADDDSAMHLVTGYENGMVKVWGRWSARAPAELRSAKVAEGVAVRALHYINDGGLLVVISAGSGVTVKPQLAVWKMEYLAMGSVSSCVLPPSACLSSAQFLIEPAHQVCVRRCVCSVRLCECSCVCVCVRLTGSCSSSRTRRWWRLDMRAARCRCGGWTRTTCVACWSTI